MDDTRRHIFRTIENYHMIEPGMRVIAGVSGGADSVCLLNVLEHYRREVPFELLVVHVEHGLRGQESLADAVFVETLCKTMQIPCRVVHADVRGRMSREGHSCEEAGRAERYRIFGEVCRDWGAQRIAVAHNENDQAETVLWNLVRGSGLLGLGGIRPVQGKIIRPLLFTRREEIERYLRDEGVSWRTDATNLGTDFTRNRIRLSVLPLMEQELNAQAGRHIAEAAGRLREAQEYIDRMTNAAAARCIDMRETSVCIRLEPFKKEESLIQKELLKRAIEKLCTHKLQGEICGTKDFGAVHLEMLMRLADMDCGKSCDLPNGIRAVREDGILRFERRHAVGMSGAAGEPGGLSSGEAWRLHTETVDFAGSPRPASSCEREEMDANASGSPGRPGSEQPPCAVRLPVPGQAVCGGSRVTAELAANTPELKKQFLEEKKYTKWISYDTIKGNLLLRTRRTGDYLVVNAQGGTKKLKDYFIDRKIPRAMRDEILLLADGPHILWVIGYRISEDAKVTENTGQVLKVMCENAKETVII